METVLHTPKSQVEKSLHVKEYTLAVLLDIESTFNNINQNLLRMALIVLTWSRF